VASLSRRRLSTLSRASSCSTARRLPRTRTGVGVICRSNSIGEQPVPPVRRSPNALARFTLMADLVWLWVVYRVDSDAVFGAIRRAEKLYRTAEEARSAVEQIADQMGAGEIRWDQTDEATWVARATRYVCVVWSIRLPESIRSKSLTNRKDSVVLE